MGCARGGKLVSDKLVVGTVDDVLPDARLAQADRAGDEEDRYGGRGADGHRDRVGLRENTLQKGGKMSSSFIC